ncbi:MAG: hypothetical protein HY277_08805 [Ignavibacteriales bacterium]|nr:hypothetical protein [Ignavibacteriales bacterium]
MKLQSVFILAVFLSTEVLGQFPPSSENELRGGVGMTWINNQPFYTFHLMPEFSFSTIGIGLDLNLEFDSHGTLRKENFNEFSDYASVIRYIRYGRENDQIFVKLGALDYVTIGHGSIISTYNNSPSFDARKIGLESFLNFDKFGVQAMYGNFGQAGVAGLRGYIRPVQFSSLADVPIIGNMEIGATYAGDFDRYAYIDTIRALNPLDVGTKSSLNIIGADIGLPIIRGEVANIELFVDYVKILDFGKGTAAGIIFNVHATENLTLQSRLERLFNGDNYLPSYFNSFYEIDRFNTVTGVSKSYALKYLTNNSNGYYGDLLVRVINTFDIVGSYQKLDKFDSSGIVHVATDVSPKGSPVILKAGYDKINIASWQDLVTTDDRSYLYAEIGYKPIEYLIIWFCPVPLG